MIDWMSMQDTYNSRKVARNEFDWGLVSTAQVIDGEREYETAVRSNKYYGPMIIVEAYTCRDDAEAGHNRWVEIMTTNPPEQLVDCGNSEVEQLYIAMYGKPHIATLRV